MIPTPITFELLQRGCWGMAAIYFFGNTMLGLVGVFLGVYLAQLIEQGGVQ